MIVTTDRKNYKRRIGFLITSAVALSVAACTTTLDDSGGSVGSGGSGGAGGSGGTLLVAGTTVTIDFSAVGAFKVVADVPIRIETEVTLFAQPPADEPLVAVLRLLPEDIRVSQPTSAKATDGASQVSGSGPSGQLRVRVVLGAQGFGLFDAGQDLGVIEVSVTDGVVTAVQSDLAIPTLVLNQILSGFFTMGLEALAQFDGTIEIDNINIDFGMTEDDANAPAERRACCFARNGPAQCLDIGFIDALRTVDDCAQNFNGVALAIGTTCGELPCESSEACCLRDGQCADISALACKDRSGTTQGAATQCTGLECPSDTPEPQDCSDNGECNVLCPDVEPDPDCSNAEICFAKKFCCGSDLVCDIQRCNELDSDCTNFLFCDRLGGCCDDDNVCHTEIDGRACPQEDQDCSFCGIDDDVCIRGCTPDDPDCSDTVSCPQDNRCEVECAGVDPDCALCEADALGTCVSDCAIPDPDCFAVTNITAEGTPFASSVFNDNFLTIRATDGDSATNWFSGGTGGGGPDSNSESFTWVRNLSGDTSITRIETDPETVDGGFGFLVVQVLVLNAADAIVFDSGFLTMAASQVDLNVSLPEGIVGNRVILTLVTHENSSCGGFSEFRVFGLRD